MRGVFISYRRQDSQSAAGRLADHLKDHLGSVPIFRDVETIEPGVDFIDAIDHALKSCSVLLAVIGPRWLTIADATGRRRIDDPHDYNRLEVAAALKRSDVRVIPVLVEATQMPATDDLPDDLKSLSRRNAVELTDKRWDYDVSQLVETLRRVIDSSEDGSGTGPVHQTDASYHRARHSFELKRYRPAFIGVGALLAVTLGFVLWPGNPEPPPLRVDEIEPGISTTQPESVASNESRAAKTTPSEPDVAPETAALPKSPSIKPPKLNLPVKTVLTPSDPTHGVSHKHLDAEGIQNARNETLALPAALTPANTAISEAPIALVQPKASAPKESGSALQPRTPQPKRIVVHAWGQTSSRNFWTGISSNEYSQRVSTQLASVLKDQLPAGFSVEHRSHEKPASEMAIKHSRTAFERACREDDADWVFAVYVQDIFAISSADSFWPEMRLAALRCGQSEPTTAKFDLSPRQGETFPFSREMRDAMQDFVAARRPGKS